jgi:hypothetical protein
VGEELAGRGSVDRTAGSLRFRFRMNLTIRRRLVAGHVTRCG